MTNHFRKLVILSLLVFCTSISLMAFATLSAAINQGQKKVDVGQKRIDEGEQKLKAGKARLEKGKQQLYAAQQSYRQVNSIPLMGIINKLPITDIPFKIASGEIENGKTEVAQGENEVKLGEAELAAGKLALRVGKDELKFYNYIRIGCGALAVLFFIFMMVFSIYWRRV